jgi:hypothetical protein
MNLFSARSDQLVVKPVSLEMSMSARKLTSNKAHRDTLGRRSLGDIARELRLNTDESVPRKDERLRWRQFLVGLRTQAAKRSA